MNTIVKLTPAAVHLFLRFCLCMIFLWGIIRVDGVCFAQSGFDDDEDPVFESDIKIEIPAAAPEKEKTFLDRFMDDSILTLSHAFSYGTDSPEKVIDNVTSCRLEYGALVGEQLFFKFDGKAALHIKNDHVAEAKEKDLYPDAAVRELYLKPGFEKFNLAFGKQVVIWGKADTAAITDVVAPRDQRRFLFTELEDARLGQWMISGTYFQKEWKTFLFLAPLPQTDETPDRNTRYYRQLFDESIVSVTEDEPDFGDMEFGIKVDAVVSKTDISIMAGRFYTNAGVYDYSGITSDSRLGYKEVFPSFLMAGAAVSHAWKNFIFKAEAAYKNDDALQGVTAGGLYTCEKRDIFDAAVGVEYNANDKYEVTLEISNRFIVFGTGGLAPGTDENSTALYATVSKHFFNQTLDIEYTIYQHLQEKNRFQQFKVTYDLTDNIILKADYTFFNITDSGSQLWPYRREDRIGFEISFYF